MKLSYHQKYNALLQKFSAKKLYNLVLSFTEKQGNPYPLRKRGRKPKLLPYEYAAYMAYMTLIKGAPFRLMEFESELYTDTHIDHATFVVNFEKVPVDYYLTLVEEAGVYLDRLLEYSNQYVVDSTGVPTPLRLDTVIKGKRVKQTIEYKSHIIASLHPENKSVVVRKVLATSKYVADCEAARRMLASGAIRNITLHGDRSYDYERVYETCSQNNIKANIRPLEYKGPVDYQAKEGSHRLLGITEYEDYARKKYRGRIEVVFGGITNAGLMTTRLRKESKILAYSVIIMLRHNIFTIARNLATIIELLTKLGATPLSVIFFKFKAFAKDANFRISTELFYSKI